MHYRLYFMNAVSGHIEGVEEFDESSDADALAKCCAFVGKRPVELWCERRKVTRLEARDLTEEMLERRRWARAIADAQRDKQTA
jgi:hypothetical protein